MTKVVRQIGPTCLGAAVANATGTSLADFAAHVGHDGEDGYSMAEALSFLAERGLALGLSPNLISNVYEADEQEPATLTLTLPPDMAKALLEGAEARGYGIGKYTLEILGAFLEVSAKRPVGPVIGEKGTSGEHIRQSVARFYAEVPLDIPAILSVELEGVPHAVFWTGQPEMAIYDGNHDTPQPLESYTSVKAWYPLLEVRGGGMLPLWPLEFYKGLSTITARSFDHEHQ